MVGLSRLWKVLKIDGVDIGLHLRPHVEKIGETRRRMRDDYGKHEEVK